MSGLAQETETAVTLETTFPLAIGLALVFGLAFAIDFSVRTGRDASGTGEPLAWTPRRSKCWQVATLVTVLAVFGSCFYAAISIPVRDRNITEAALEQRYGHDFEYVVVGRTSGLWYIDGQPTACAPHGELPHDPYVQCAELDQLNAAAPATP